MAEAVDPAIDAAKRRILFTPLKTKEDLHNWILVFLGLDWPMSLVDEESTASPMDAIWEIYEASMNAKEPKTFLNYAARDTYKTLGAAVLEVLALVHMNRSVAHMAAIEPQAKKAQSYVKKFLRRPYLRDFATVNNERKIEFVRYQHRVTGENLPDKAWKHLPTDADRDQYEEMSQYVTIVVCTMAGANSEHVPFMVVDELDVVPNLKAYEESKMIPAPSHDGRPPITLLTSTRKTNRGPVQDEIDNADARGTTVSHWNLIDVTKACPTDRHLPLEERIPIYINDVTLEAISEEQYEDIVEDQKRDAFVREEGYAGCLKNCKIFAACKGRLATEQKSNSPLLRDVTHTQAQFRKVSSESALAQLLCRKANAEGLIYSRLEPEIHCIDAEEMAFLMTGERMRGMTKQKLVALAHSRDVQFFAGMDFGFTHNFAVVQGFRDGARMFVFDCISAAQLELPQMFDICETRVLPNRPTVFPDTAYPQYVKEFKRRGYRVRDWDKGKGTVVGGIETVRLKLRPTGSPPELYFLRGDEGCELLVKRMGQYKWTDDSQGRPIDVPDKTDDDECDALRYMVMNVFAPKGKITTSKPEETNPLTKVKAQQTPQQTMQQQWNQVMGHIGMQAEAEGESVLDDSPKPKGKNGGFVWEMG